MLPLVPSNGHSSLSDSKAAIGASGAEEMDDDGFGSDAEFDPLFHDFCSDVLPAAIARCIAKMTAKHRFV